MVLHEYLQNHLLMVIERHISVKKFFHEPKQVLIMKTLLLWVTLFSIYPRQVRKLTNENISLKINYLLLFRSTH